MRKTYSNPYRDIARKARRVRKRQLKYLPTDSLKAAWDEILGQLVDWQVQATQTNRKARDKRCGTVSCVTEARRLEGLRWWLDGGCQMADWDELLAKESTPREQEIGGWVSERVLPRGTIVTRDLRRIEIGV